MRGKRDLDIPHLVAICNVKGGDGTLLERVERYVQPRDVGQNRRDHATLAQITWLRGGLQLGKCPQLAIALRYIITTLRGYELRARQSSDKPAKIPHCGLA